MVDAALEKTVACSVKIVSAYVTRNSIAPGDLPALIASIYAAFQALSQDKTSKAAAEPQKPVISIKKSVTDDYLVCLEDGRRFKSLKRHLRVRYGLTPEQYRLRWQLPPDYPMVAPGYAQKRSLMAKSMGLGNPRAPRTPG